MMQQEENPMLNSLILENVFRYCHLEELKRCRLVCHLWKQECRPHIRFRAKTTYYYLDIVKEFTLVMKNTDYLPMANFYFLGPAVYQVKTFSEDFGPSVNSIRLNCWRTNIEPTYLFSLLGKFSNIKEVELKNLPTSFHLTDRIFSPETEFPVLSTVKKVSLTQECSFGMTLALLNICPNMATFKFGWCNNVSNQILALRSLDSSRHSKIKKIKIKGVDFDFETAKEILMLLTKFKLQKLNFSSCTIEDQNNQLGKLFSQLCQQQSTTLQKLVLPVSSSGDSSGNLAIIFPKMAALKRIAFSVHPVRFSFPSMSLYFPNLKVLDLKKFEINNFHFVQDIFPSRDNTTPNSSFNLHSLLLPAKLKTSHHDFVISLAKVFPTVENITVFYQEPEILESIWSSWPNLLGLNISEDKTKVDCFTTDKYNAVYLGLDPFDCFRLNTSEDYLQPDFTINSTKSSIKDLKELRSLKLASQILTDITGYMGISKLQKLMNLELKCPNITQTCLDGLTQRLPSLISCMVK